MASDKNSAKIMRLSHSPVRGSALREISRAFPKRPLSCGEKNSASSRASKKRKRGLVAIGCTFTTKRKSLPSTDSIPKWNSDSPESLRTPMHHPVIPESAQVISSLVESVRHLFSCVRASSDELIFLTLASRIGIRAARHMASELSWKVHRPIAVLRVLGVD